MINLSGLLVRGDGGAGNDTFNVRNSRSSWNRVTVNGGDGNDTFNVDDNSNKAASNLLTIT